MESQPLKLNITKGPRAGETLEFRPGSRVRVGRVVRGNNIAIKDAGISSKHLSIDFDTDSGQWILQDLDSSNGTFLNDTTVSPGKPYFLRDADVVKIGESTSITVELINSVAVDPKLRGNPRRRAAGRKGLEGAGGTEEANDSKEGAKGSVVKQEIIDLDLQEGLINEEASKKVVEPAQANPRRTRGRKKAEEKNLAFGSASPRATENQYGLECGEKKAVEGRTTRAAVRRARNLDEAKQVKEACADFKDSTEVLNSGEEAREKEKLLSKQSEEQHELVSQSKRTENKRKQAGSRRRKKPDEDEQMGVLEDFERLHTVEEARDEGRDDEGDVNVLNLGEEDRNLQADNRDVGGIVEGTDPNLGEGCQDVVDNRGSNAEAGSKKVFRVDEITREDGSLPDLTEITLREWFDFMEVHLPKQIIDETEKMIAKMMTKADRVREYVVEQKANKCKEPIR